MQRHEGEEAWQSVAPAVEQRWPASSGISLANTWSTLIAWRRRIGGEPENVLVVKTGSLERHGSAGMLLVIEDARPAAYLAGALSLGGNTPEAELSA